MALQTSGHISLGDIRSELSIDNSPFSIRQAELGNYVSINQSSVSRPNGSAEHKISEWYGYDHFYSGNTPPTAYDSSYYNVSSENGIVIYLDASDPEGDPLDYYIMSLPSNGTLLTNETASPITSTPFKLVNSSDGSSTDAVRYVPDVSNNSDSFDFKVIENTTLNDDNFESNVATIYIIPDI